MESFITAVRNHRLGKLVRLFFPESVVNLFWHLPKSVLANILFGFPSRKLKVIGITGTKGKTTTAHLLYHILSSAGKKTALITTLSARLGKEKIDTGLHVTNPNPFALQQLIKKMAVKGYEFLVLEVTSHGLSQFRNWGIVFDLGIITNIYSDHLLYHKTLENYRHAKAKLIKMAKAILININDPAYDYLRSVAVNQKKKAYTFTGKPDDFESQNREAALKAAEIIGVRKVEAAKSLASFKGIEGRMQVIKKNPFYLVIDFAHTPESLQAALTLLAKYKSKNGRMIAVFGCAGDRDHGRRRMGQVAAEKADLFLITAEDPRCEKLEEIIAEIANYAQQSGAQEVRKAQLSQAACNSGHSIFCRVPDRKTAIFTAVRLAKPGDVIGLFGKGHEKSMCFGTREIYWSEIEVAKRALKKYEN